MKNYKLKKFRKKIKTTHKNGKKIITFDDTEIEEYEFHQFKSPILINAIDINKIVSNKILDR